MCALSALISTSTYFPAFQCVCILIAWEKASWKRKKEVKVGKEKENVEKFFSPSFLFCPLKKKLWFLNCPPNFLGSMSYCITNYYDYSYTMINRDFLNLKNYKSRWTIRNKDECWKKKLQIEQRKKSYTGAIIKSILIGFWQHFYSFCVYLEQFYVLCQ